MSESLTTWGGGNPFLADAEPGPGEGKQSLQQADALFIIKLQMSNNDRHGDTNAASQQNLHQALVKLLYNLPPQSYSSTCYRQLKLKASLNSVMSSI